MHLLAELGGARLGLGIEVGDASYLDELFSRLFEARDGIAGKKTHSLSRQCIKRPRPPLTSRRPFANHVFCSLAALRSLAVILTVGRLKSSGQTIALTSASSFLPAFLMRLLRMVLPHSGD